MKVKFANRWYEVAMVQENFGQKWYEIYDEPDTNPEHTDWIAHPDEVIEEDEEEIIMENYKEKYEMALERCRKLYNEAKTLDYSQDLEDYETIFPELKESEDEVTIPFGAKDSELIEETYYIPQGMEAIIEDDKVIIRKKESEDERIRKRIYNYINVTLDDNESAEKEKWLAWLEKQKCVIKIRCNQ